MPQQIEFFEIPSPCKRDCRTDSHGYCVACLRSRQERFNWLTMSDEERREVMRLCRQRRLRRAYLLRQKLQAEQQANNNGENQLDLF